MSKKQWVWLPRKTTGQLTVDQKAQIKVECDHLVDSVLKPKYVVPKKKTGDSYITDIYCKWYRNFLHFVALVNDDHPRAIQSQYEEKFARLEAKDSDLFYLCYFRHTGEWFDLTHGQGASLKKCLECIRDMPHFIPV